ncbi:MAG: nucleotidyl transferase AbiEii/AbiGii toxin family protein [Candidatus Latescibacteria bacterium]|nr:nucleotidyl transferase AbiEii/AbiGii toxin family protein [Candidatus Latescibacterota bacterium]
MISRQDILDRAGEWQLRPDVVEKDYVLGWLLAVLAKHPITSTKWTFKGGTCLKKCFFETYRFSEDLDFTLDTDAPYTDAAIRGTLQEIARSVAELSGVYAPEDEVRVEAIMGPGERLTFQGRIYYRGPLQRGGDLARVLFDLTRLETIVSPAVLREVFHPYPDALPAGATVRTYSLDEVLAEKTRALYERTRPRDLYDVVYILENHGQQLNLDEARTFFRAKCVHKRLDPPNTDALIERIQTAHELRSEWANMLGHQLPTLPPIDAMLERARLSDVLGWLDAPVVMAEVQLAAPSSRGDEEIIAPVGIRYWGAGSVFEKLRFAGGNRLLVEFDYDGRRRHVEPYSLRRARTGRILFYGWERDDRTIKSYNVTRILNLTVTSTAFVPKYRVELSTTEPLRTPLARRSLVRPRATRRYGR